MSTKYNGEPDSIHLNKPHIKAYIENFGELNNMKYLMLLGLLSGCVSFSKPISDASETWVNDTTSFMGLVSVSQYYYCTKPTEILPPVCNLAKKTFIPTTNKWKN